MQGIVFFLAVIGGMALIIGIAATIVHIKQWHEDVNLDREAFIESIKAYSEAFQSQKSRLTDLQTRVEELEIKIKED